MDEASLRRALAGSPAHELFFFQTTGSTNDLAFQLAAAGASDGALVVADEQTAGRGRLSRRWVTRPGAALAFSLVLRPSVPESGHLSLFAPLCGLAVAQVLQQEYGLDAKVKWPNDVLINQRKTCGVLVEANWRGTELAGLVAGIGVNVTQSAVPPAGELRFPATCIEAELGRPIEREALLAVILRRLFALRPTLGSAEFFAAWEACLAFRGQAVRIEGPAGAQEGTLLGISPSGSLRLRSPDGSEFEVEAGDVRLRPINM